MATYVPANSVFRARLSRRYSGTSSPRAATSAHGEARHLAPDDWRLRVRRRRPAPAQAEGIRLVEPAERETFSAPDDVTALARALVGSQKLRSFGTVVACWRAGRARRARQSEWSPGLTHWGSFRCARRYDRTPCAVGWSMPDIPAHREPGPSTVSRRCAAVRRPAAGE